MAGNIPMGSMSTEIKLNGSQSVKTLRELKQAVTQATSAWKAQRAELSNIGKSTEAAEAKYKGLGEAIKKQKDYISGLQVAQKHLENAQQSVDRTTKEGRQEYGKYNEALQKNETRLHSAQQKLASLTTQQTKAKSSLSYYKSGLADVQKQLKVNESVAKSYVVRLKAEGKGYESAKAKLNSYKNSLINLKKQQSIQTQELSRIAKETGKSSDAYKRQEVRVNQTATSIAKLNGKIKSSQTEVNKLNPHGFNKLANGAKHVTNAADKMKSGLKHAWDNVKTGATAAAAGIGAVGAAAISGAKKAGNLQQTYKEITNLAVTGGEKQREAIKNVTAMQRQGRDMSIKYGKSQQDIAEAFEDLVKRGYTTKQALGAMKTELQGSVASGDDFKDVVSVSSTVLESFGMRAKTVTQMTSNTKRAVNELAYAADMTSTGFKDLGYGMSYTASSAHQAGFNLSETASAMGILSNNGLEASKAGTGLNQVINRLSDATGKLVKGDKKNALAKLGIKPKEITDSTGKLRNLATVFGVLNKHMKGMTKVQKINIMKSLFGMTGEQAGLILAKYNKQLGSLSKNVLKAGKDGKYVADLSAKNSQTAKMQMARLKQAGDAFTMTLGAKMLPAINEAGDSLVVFLTKSKDGKRLTNDFAHAVEGLANGLAKTIEWIAHHRTETKAIATGLGAAYGVVKLASFVQWINKTRLAMSGLKVGTHLINGFKHLGSAAKISGKLIKATGKGIAFAGKTMGKGFIKQLGLIGKGIKGLGSGILKAVKGIGSQALSAGKFLGSKITQGIKATMKFSMGKRLATGALAGAAVATPEVINAVKDRHNANKRSQDIGGAVGAVAGGTLTSMIPVVGPMLAPVGAIIGKYAGRWGGQAVNNFTKGWQKNKPPKKFWSLENLGYSAHNMWNGFMKGIKSTLKWFKKNWKEVGLYFVSPLAGAINSLYKHNPKFRKWVKNLVKSFKNAWKGIGKWFGNIGKSIQRSWKGMTHWFSNLGKSMAKGLKSAWKGMTKWFSNIGRGIKKAWRSMTSWFTKLGKDMSKGLKATWHGMVKFFSDIGKNVKHAWNSMTSFFSKLGKNTVNFFKRPWKAITGWFKNIISGIKSAWDGFWDHISGPIKTLQKLFTGKLKVGSLHLANGTDWKHKYGYPAILNDGSDSPATGNREGILNPDGTVEVQNGVNIKRWIFPWQDVINAHDMARIFGRSVRLANGTVNLRSLETNDPTKLLSTLTKLTKKKYDEDRQHNEKQKQRHDRNDNDRATERKRLIKQEHDAKSERAKIAKEIREALSKGRNTKGLTAQLNALTKHISNIKHSIAKTNPHHGQVYVDEGLLIGAKSRIGKSKWISDALFKKLTTKPKKRKTTHKRSTSHRRLSTRKTVTRVSTPHVSGKSVRVNASVSGLSNVRSLANAISAVKSKSVKVTASGSSAKSVSSLAHAIKKIKGGTHKVTVKTRGTKSVKSLARAIKKVKGKRSKVTVKSYGSKGLKSLQRNITLTNRQVKSLTKEAKKAKFGKAISQQAVEAVKSLKGKGNFAKQFEKMTKQFDKDLKTMSKNSKKEFKSMWSENEKTSKSGEQKLNSELSSFSSKFKHSWSSLENGVHRAFSHFWTNMKNAAGKGVNSVIKVLNSAISKIDNVISDFGGSKTAVHKSGYVHYAGGTDANGRLTQDTLAIVNDAKSGPRQEAIVTDTNDVLLPRGKDVPVMLKKGWGVLNGTQTQQLGLPHFANGTGLKRLYEIAKHNWNHPVKTGQSMFGAVIGLTGAIKELASGMRNKSENQGTKWWSQLWKMVEDKVDDDLGPASGLLKAVEKLGRGKRYLWGGYGLDSKGLDCSGLVSTALEHYFHSGWGHLDVGGLWQHAHRISRSEAKPGDPVFWLPDEHVGVYAGHGMYYSAYGPNDGGPIGMQPVGSGATFGRFKGINTEGSKDTKEAVKVKANNRLQKQIKNQVGQGFWHTIQKIADKYGELFSGANSISGSMIEAAARKMHVHLPDGFVKDVLRVAMSESGNRNIKQQIHDVNSGGNEAQGPLQFTPQTFKAFAVAGHTNIHNPYDELLAFFNNSDWRNSIGWTTIWGHRKFDWLHSGPQGHRRFANGGIASSPSIFGEAGPEMAVPLIPSKSTRAWELIGKAVGILSSQTNLQVQNVNNEKERKEEHDFRQAVLLLLTEIAGKSDVAKITLTTPAGRALWSIIQPFQKQEMKSEITRLRRGLSGR